VALIWFYSHANEPYFDKNAFAVGLAVVLELSSITSVLFFSQRFHKLLVIV